MKNKMPELLAPAGTPEAAWSALAYGADAIYAGLDQFSARAEAGNFTPEQLNELIGYAHHLDRRVFVTFNTLVQERELKDAIETIALIRDLKADAIIIQDLGIADIVKKNFPTLRLHASTQLATHNLAGAQELAKFGFKRVVLARELGIDAIKNISQNAPIETEVFIHGALCYSYSGLCLLSSHLLGRSGNRGRCAYSCRQQFTSDGKRTLPFSMKDFCAAEKIELLKNSGVSALKMEGRMKGPHYVAAVTEFYRQSLDGTIKKPEERLADIQTIFGRPSTDLYLSGENNEVIDPVNDGHRGAKIGNVLTIDGQWLIFTPTRALEKRDGIKIEMPNKSSAYGFAANEMYLASDRNKKLLFKTPANQRIAIKLPDDAPFIEKGSAIYCSYSQSVRQRYQFNAPRPGQFRQNPELHMHIHQTEEAITLTAKAGKTKLSKKIKGPFEKAQQPEKAAASFEKCFNKLGETQWQLGQFSLEGEMLFVPASILNEARRNLVDDFTELWQNEGNALFAPTDFINSHQLKNQPTLPPNQNENVNWSVKARRFIAFKNIDEFVLEIAPEKPEEIQKAFEFYGEKLRLALPTIIRDNELNDFETLIQNNNRISKWEASNIGAIHLLKHKSDITADWSLYTLNSHAAQAWHELKIKKTVLSPEDDAQNIFALLPKLGHSAIITVYQHTPLMISATKPKSGIELIDRNEREFSIRKARNEFVMLHKKPFSIVEQIDDLIAFGAKNLRIDLSYGTETDSDFIEKIQNHEIQIDGKPFNFSTGLL